MNNMFKKRRGRKKKSKNDMDSLWEKGFEFNKRSDYFINRAKEEAQQHIVPMNKMLSEKMQKFRLETTKKWQKTNVLRNNNNNNNQSKERGRQVVQEQQEERHGVQSHQSTNDNNTPQMMTQALNQKLRTFRSRLNKVVSKLGDSASSSTGGKSRSGNSSSSHNDGSCSSSKDEIVVFERRRRPSTCSATERDEGSSLSLNMKSSSSPSSPTPAAAAAAAGGSSRRRCVDLSDIRESKAGFGDGTIEGGEDSSSSSSSSSDDEDKNQRQQLQRSGSSQITVSDFNTGKPLCYFPRGITLDEFLSKQHSFRNPDGWPVLNNQHNEEE